LQTQRSSIDCEKILATRGRIFKYFSAKVAHKKVSAKELAELNKLLKTSVPTGKRPGL
jgi:hypothetical protein